MVSSASCVSSRGTLHTRHPGDLMQVGAPGWLYQNLGVNIALITQLTWAWLLPGVEFCTRPLACAHVLFAGIGTCWGRAPALQPACHSCVTFIANLLTSVSCSVSTSLPCTSARPPAHAKSYLSLTSSWQASYWLRKRRKEEGLWTMCLHPLSCNASLAPLRYIDKHY